MTLMLMAVALAVAHVDAPRVGGTTRPTAAQLTRRGQLRADARALLARATAERARTIAAPTTIRERDRLVEEISRQIDEMDEMGETESLRLQMAMDRLSQLMSTLSNMMKKSSDTAQDITQNLK